MNIKFALRDDDTSYFTEPEELEAVYKHIWAKGISTSLAVVPYAVKSHNCGSQGVNFYQEKEKKAIGENKRLIQYLREKIKEKKVTIMLHGHTHQYKAAKNKKDLPLLATKDNLTMLKKDVRGENLIFIGEYAWKNYSQLKKETRLGKDYLEDLFGTKINVFVAPSNAFSKDAVKAVAECDLDICGGTMRIMYFNRNFSMESLKFWLLKVLWKAKYRRVYPHTMDYKSHKEVHAYGLVPNVTLESLKRDYNFCCSTNAPFILATHYWQVNTEPKLTETLEAFINYVHTENKSQFVPVNTLF
ncbi:MAG TPA: hypothetical protein DF296_01885 [Candidatus Margulisbacteria bacterium]|nr:MAG: hypothetical protein A2X43_05185 [Candidatus Margulisbacteria bacterium GWD2_39_127]OGI04965.1 MAG: hypothetical protein A2X42_03265 [Candidatus Margulisbacteria bacterium GWF2_38_17]OGI06635.1 MAG: hypothetical protein A2X41_05515 [Candidatus Margulisbacteria bacterium GWE2_39_32]HAR63580.1 hypothetical protein [Candidatus Margulisiibacteriota bacterium]HCT83927.1 hypothetical protein [Candidatus Margulisiibacteriota bacterium]